MIVKFIVKNKYKTGDKEITVWIQKDKSFDDCLNQIFQFFKDNIKIFKKRRFRQFYKIKSDNPAIVISLLSTIQELILETYFDNDNSDKIEESSVL